MRPFSILLCLLFLSARPGTAWSQKVVRDADGMVTGITDLPIGGAFLNPVDPAAETEWWKRVQTVLRANVMEGDKKFKPVDSRTFFESEKWSYPSAFMHILAGNVDPAVKVLEAEDADAKAHHEYTEGIDLWAGFTVQGQTAKYFFAGPLLSANYRQRMSRAIKQWTETNPHNTPHPKYQKYNPEIKDGWGPDRFGNKRVDARRTDAMWGFTSTASYLFAEAAGNESTRQENRDEIFRYAWSLYNVGMGEWDSSTYAPYSIAPYLNLHAYAKDPAVRMAAKLVLDFYHTAAALNYRKGLFSGVSKRDYNNAYRMYAGGSNNYFPTVFGGAAGLEKSREAYLAYAMISPYRPAPAMLAVARRDFPTPVEVLSTKPTYETWKMTATSGPSFFATQYISKTYDLSSVVSGGGDGDVAPFRLVFDKDDSSAESFVASSRARFAEKFPGDAIGQFRNLLVWIAPASDKESFHFAWPARIRTEQKSGWTFADTGRAWFALRGFGLGELTVSEAANPKELEERQKNLGDVAVFRAARQGASPGGFALITGGPAEFASFAKFQSEVLASAKVDDSRLASGTVRLTGPGGAFVEVTRADGLPTINRNGEVRDWADPKNWRLYQTVGGDLVSLGWKEGTLDLQAGGKAFRGTVTMPGWQKPDASPEDLEKAKGLNLEAVFSNR